MPKLPHVLIVEDDPTITSALALAFRNDYQIDTAATGKQAIYKSDIEDYELVILDLGLPDISGLDVCQQLRERGNTRPILVLSGETSAMVKIKLLDAGANDFLTKPFSLGELKARMRALMRSSPHSTSQSRQISVGDILLDRQKRTVSRSGMQISLRRKEFALLECLMDHAGSVVSRDLLTNRAWEDSTTVWTNTVDVHIKHLRDKIDRPFAEPLIKTIHGLGYKLDSETVQDK